jgi:phosphoesterase RecJ-like protein
MRAVIEAIRRHRSFIVSSHVNPEGDALGSALGLSALLKRLGKRVVLATDGGIPPELRFLPRMIPLISRPRGNLSAEVSMIVDVATFSRVGSMERLIRRIPLTVNIDHHVSNHRFGDINWIDPNAAAVGEMIYRLYRAFGLRPRREEALCLYVSIVTDTGSFRYMNTTPAVHQIAADLIATGLSPVKVAQQLYESHSVRDLVFLGTVLKALRHSPDGKVAWLEISNRLLKAYRVGPEIVDELVNYPRSLKSAEVALVFREAPEPGKVRVNLRSKGRINVNEIARAFDGGGHRAASGCTVGGTLSQAREKVLRVVRKHLR